MRVPESLPLFPLQSVLFPGVLLPLHVFEERYRLLVQQLLHEPDESAREFGVIAIRQGWEVGPDAARSLHPIGCTALMRRVENKEDGTYEVVSAGGRRFRLLEVDATSEPYLVGSVEWLPDEPDPGPETTLLARRAGTLFEEYVAAVAGTGGAEVAAFELPEDPTVLSYLVASAALLTLDDRQALLERDSTRERIRHELRLLRRETALVRELRVVPTSLAEITLQAGTN